jgi:hypothetical protein
LPAEIVTVAKYNLRSETCGALWCHVAGHKPSGFLLRIQEVLVRTPDDAPTILTEDISDFLGALQPTPWWFLETLDFEVITYGCLDIPNLTLYSPNIKVKVKLSLCFN